MAGMVNGCDAPRDADPQEDVHRVTSGHVPDARIGVLVLAGGHLARERVCNKSHMLRFSLCSSRNCLLPFCPPVCLFVYRFLWTSLLGSSFQLLPRRYGLVIITFLLDTAVRYTSN